jgi:ribonuclease VapC
MGIEINRDETVRLAREIAEAMGETVDDLIHQLVVDRHAQLSRPIIGSPEYEAQKRAFFAELDARRIVDPRPWKQIEEPEAELFYDLIRAALAPKLCAVSFVELVEVFARRMDERDPLAAAQRIVETLGVSIIALSVDQAVLASQARNVYGRGRHVAGLNFGDVFVYALAKSLDEPLLFKGNDFIHTDVKRAAP